MFCVLAVSAERGQTYMQLVPDPTALTVTDRARCRSGLASKNRAASIVMQKTDRPASKVEVEGRHAW